jgi:cellulose synthase/poly-beta-1,6-N-acetylglucosamine synthase-like glycosyltransferase
MSASWLIVAAIVVLNLAVLPYFIFLLAAAIMAIVAGRSRSAAPSLSSKFLIIVPAHDEEGGIAATVRSCKSSNYPSLLFDVAVIADNCSDQTAAMARAAGARVFERSDNVKKSKGYAIEYLLELLTRSGELAALDAVVIVDADTTIDPGLLAIFDQGLRDGHDWIQAYYTVANPDQSWRTRLMTYAFSLFNGVLQLGQVAMGSSAGLKGNGMCFSTRGLGRRPWKAYGLVEDMEFSWMLRVGGEKIWFARNASVYGAMLGTGGKAAAQQRRRWEFGRSSIRKKFLGPLLRSNDLGFFDKIVSVCELTLPSMAQLAIIYVFVVAADLGAIVALRTASLTPVRECLGGGAILLTVALLIYAISPFLVMRLPWRFASSIAFFPFYMAWKVLVSLGGRPQQWVRTLREPQG